MAAARSEKMFTRLGTRGFTLVEILIAVAVLSILYGCLFLTGGSLARRLSDPYSEENLAKEVARATAWLDDQIYRATLAGKNFEIAVSPSSPSGILSVRWQGDYKWEEWKSESIGMRVYSTGQPVPAIFRYDWQTQMLTPALTLRIFKQKDLRFTTTKWFIIISAYGLTRMSEISS